MGDPLGATQSSLLVDVNKLPRWSQSVVPEYDIIIDDPASKKQSPFVYAPDINEKIVLWTGDITCINCEAIVNSTNETLNDRHPACERIIYRGGSDLKREIRTNVKGCRTGEAKMTKGYKLPARYVIHTVGPRYNIRYKTAAESALYNSYRSTLQVMKENKISSLGLCCIHSLKRNYPSHEGAHIAVRTVRRFLEKYGHTVETIVFIANGEDKAMYESLLPLYFPRSSSEEDFAAYHLPEDVGNEDGEPVIAERQIRIIPKPTHQTRTLTSAEGLEESIDINEAFETSVAVGSHAFARMEADVDNKRRNKNAAAKKRQPLDEDEIQIRQERRRRYERWLKRAKREDLGAIASLRCLYQSGFDVKGRPVIVFLGRNFPAEKIDYDKALLYFIATMDPVVNQPYVVVYLHTMTEKEHQPESDFIRDIYDIVDERYKQNLHAIYMVHSTLWSKIVTWFFATFSAYDIKNKIRHIPGLEYLYTRILPDQLDLPGFVTEYDIRENGTRYYNPEQDEDIGDL